MTTIEQKAKLLDNFIIEAMQMKTADKFTYAINKGFLADKLIQDYKAIEKPKSFSEDPYIDEVFTGRLLNWLIEWMDVKSVPRLSNCPHINYLKNQRGLGYKSLNDYENILKKFGYLEKLQ
jgi:hypothetical protein